jgi:rhodanese-like protein
MKVKKMLAGTLFLPLFALLALAGAAAADQTDPPVRSTMAKICVNCHKPQPGSLYGTFESVAIKSASIQLKIDEATEIVHFGTGSLLVENAKGENLEKKLRAIRKGHEVRVDVIELNGVKTATRLVVKPPVKVAKEQIVDTAYVEKLIALGPVKGGYTLVDARPAPRFQEGWIPTAINMPYPAFKKMTDRLPKEKGALLVFYCSGVT